MDKDKKWDRKEVVTVDPGENAYKHWRENYE